MSPAPSARASTDHGGPAVTVTEPLSGDSFEAELEADESGVADAL
jgi:hypothetical protein